jgi:hypothetical protein
MIAGDNHTDEKFFAGVNNTGEQLSPVTPALAINLLPVSTSLVNNDDTGDIKLYLKIFLSYRRCR